MRNILISLALVLLSCPQISAQKGDEDAEMFNQVKNRDIHAIDEAVNGWWSISMKTVDQRIESWKNARFGMFVHWGIY